MVVHFLSATVVHFTSAIDRRAAAYKQTHARILLLSDEVRKYEGLTDEEVARSIEIASATVERIRRRCVEEGTEAALGRNEVLVCLDETSEQQVKETRLPRPPRPGLAVAYDYEYQRNGVSNLFMLFAPLEGWRRAAVTGRRTKVDWARHVKKLVDEDYPDKDRIVLVMDNLNTHHPASLYEAFEPMEARRIAERLEIHYTPKHGSWLNPVSSTGQAMAEIEIGVLARQCLDRRIPDQEVLRREVDAWQDQRNRDMVGVDWRFTTDDARIKLKSLYPAIQNS